MNRRDFLRALLTVAVGAPLVEALAMPPPALARPNPVIRCWILEVPEVGAVEVLVAHSREMVARQLDVSWERLPNGWARSWSVLKP